MGPLEDPCSSGDPRNRSGVVSVPPTLYCLIFFLVSTPNVTHVSRPNGGNPNPSPSISQLSTGNNTQSIHDLWSEETPGCLYYGK